MRYVIFVALLALCGGRSAAAQDARLERLDPAARAVVAGIIDSARAAGLPAEPLVDRALEGVTKRAPGDVIAAAVRRLAAQLTRAREILGPAASPAELESGAAALRAGAGSAVLAALRRTRPRQQLTVPLAVLADLVASGVPVDTAATVVLALASAADDDLLEFRRTVEHDIALGVLPGTAATVRFLDSDAAPQPAGGTPRPRPPAPRRP